MISKTDKKLAVIRSKENNNSVIDIYDLINGSILLKSKDETLSKDINGNPFDSELDYIRLAFQNSESQRKEAYAPLTSKRVSKDRYKQPVKDFPYFVVEQNVYYLDNLV